MLRIHLFGSIRIAHDDRPSSPRPTHILQGVLAYLLVHRERCHSRAALYGTFWGDFAEDRARNCLNTALWRLRRVLEPTGIPRGAYLITTPAGEVGFNRGSDYWLDLEVIENVGSSLLRKPVQSLEAEQAAEAGEALELYNAELLDGFYDDWALRERERIRQLCLNTMAHLMCYHRQRGELSVAAAYGQRILERDPLREEIHRELMRLYHDSGQRSLALRQYEICRRILSQELGVSPLVETERLRAEILAANGDQVATEQRNASEQLLQPLQMAMEGVERAREQLGKAIQALGRSYESGQ